MESKHIISETKIILLLLLLILNKVYNVGNEITIVINSTINSSIINSTYHDKISQVVVNGHASNIANYQSLLNEGINNVTIKFNRYLDTCSNMFYNLNNILIIDTYNFYSSNVKNMSYMFYGCSSLKALDL
jgi:hypothetical protein